MWLIRVLTLFCCDEIGNISSKTLRKRYEIFFTRIGYQRDSGQTSGLTGEDKARFQSVLKDTGPTWIYAYVHVGYTIPPLLIGDKAEAVSDTFSFWWNPRFERWYATDEKQHKQLKTLAEQEIAEGR
jgi:hypothetical protein